MTSRRGWMRAIAAPLIALGSIAVLAKEHGHGRGHGHDRDDEDGGHGYSDHDREEVRGWYYDHRDNLPPGLAKKDRLPPGLERQLLVRGTLPPGLQKRIRPCPIEIERRLPPPPPGYEHAIIGGHIVLLNRRTFVVLDIIHFEGW